ncbi:MAG: PQQ-binding-like beta-propeller repeat protein [Gemmataceae bacterium]
MTHHDSSGRAAALLAFVVALIFCGLTRADNWPSWRGPTGQGHTTEKELPLTWNGKTGENVIWKAPLYDDAKVKLDHNQSSPIVWGDRIFVTLSYWPADKTSKDFPEHHVRCFARQTGKKLWDTIVPPGDWLLTDLRGGYTAPTPCTDGERVYVVFGSACMAALDFQGKIDWHKKFDYKNIDVAVGTSPILNDGVLLYVCDKNNKSSKLWAFDPKNGDLKWEKDRPGGVFTHSTPILAQVGGKTQLLVAASNAVQGVDPAKGDILWWCQASGDTASPVYSDGIVYCDSGRGGPGTAVAPTGMGDVTKSLLKWKSAQVPSGFSSPIIVAGRLYRLHDPRVLTCWDLATGKELFHERIDVSTTAASPVATPEGRIYLASAGKSLVIEAGPKLKILASNDLGDPQVASPAVSGGQLFIKGRTFLFCVGKKSP